MLILTIRTDKPDSEIGLYEDQDQLSYEVWSAHRQLAETIHLKIDQILKQQGKQLTDLEGIVTFKGPGSFTGLRIGLTVANSLSYSLNIPVVATDKDWVANGVDRLLHGDIDPLALPEYGSDAFVTKQKK